MVRSVKLEVRPLFLPHLVKLTDIVAEGMHKLTWVSLDWKDFVDKSNDSIKRFKILTERVHDVYTNRVLEVLSLMQSVQLHALPEVDDGPWTIDDFCDKMDEVCRTAATDLHRKSLMVEEAVEEILMLVRKARIDCPSQNDEDIFSEDEAEQTEESGSTQQQSDWSLVWECFEKPHLLLSGGMSKAMEDMVKGAVSEMRRYYSRKVVDVLVRVTRQSLEALRRRFAVECRWSDLGGWRYRDCRRSLGEDARFYPEFGVVDTESGRSAELGGSPRCVELGREEHHLCVEGCWTVDARKATGELQSYHHRRSSCGFLQCK
mgnify:FL=1